MSFVALSSFARNARSASRVGVGSALCVALNVTSTRFRSGFSFLWRTSSCIGYRSMRLTQLRILLTLRLEVDYADVGGPSTSDEVQGAEIPDRHDRVRPADRRQDARPLDQSAHRPSEILAQRIRESQRRVGEFSERGGRTFR